MKGRKIAGIIAYVILALVIVIGIGLVAKFTGGFKSSFQNFYLTVDGKDIVSYGSGYSISPASPLTVDVKYVFDTGEGVGGDYSVKVVPNAVSGKDFDFTLDKDSYSFQAEKDLTDGFNIEKGDTGFTLTPKGSSLTEIMQAIYPEYTVGDCDAFCYEDMFTLIVTSGDGEASVRIGFALSSSVSGVTLDKEGIIF